MSNEEEEYDTKLYERQTVEDELYGWYCYTDIANATSPDYVLNTLRGNWTEDINERSGEPEFRAVGVKNVFYKPGSTLKIQINGIQKFKDDVKAVLMTHAQPYVNLKFSFVDSGGNVTIDNNAKSGGMTNCLGCQSPVISISSAQVGLVLHELGHALGMHHEMKNPNLKLTWNVAVLTQMYGGNEELVKSQIVDKIDPREVTALPFDKNSVMIYPLPATTNKEGVKMGWVNKYTDIDRQWLEITYGKPAQPLPPTTATTKPPTTTTPPATTKPPTTTLPATTKPPTSSTTQGTVVQRGGAELPIVPLNPVWVDNIINIFISMLTG